ncbi:response regulator transcription factor [Streptomyces sp. NBC_01387]|uniref:response regulator n=1 Tax=unclassified Streptomyces TaxID=2593676 RepID=UPI0022592A22|nr:MULTISPECIES: response regulator transcription factor [unclassified Streptomyces]MCX4550971.1 response regulator transcription factor [Streptomyces sp. NBC_01500]WSC22389.1 response regulator transcription factor [Streptomyces sp. NBC_01766]WSV56232.1 response regulator transcription factor [Streptomyces sp. NBC_01014]
MTIRVLVADDQAVVRDGVVLLLSQADDMEVVGQAGDGHEAVRLASESRPDVAIVDLRMPGLAGAEVTARVVRADIGVRVLILTTYADDDAVMPALRAGAAGYLTKDATGEALLAAVRDVAAGHTVLDPAVQRRLVQLVVSEPESTVPLPPAGPAPEAGIPAEAEGLTRREVDVVRLVAQGLNNRQVARDMVVSQSTVKTHLNHVLAKLALEDRGALIAWAWRYGLADRTGDR